MDDELQEVITECEYCSSEITVEEYNRTATTETCDACGHPEFCEVCGEEMMSVAEEMSGKCDHCQRTEGPY